MTTDPEVTAQARGAFQEMQAAMLAASPLAAMDAWVAAGRAPAAGTLRQSGLTAEGRREDWWLVRKAFIARWGFSIPCAEALAILWRLQPLVELGAGSGYWTAIARAAGIDMNATDLLSHGSPGYNLVNGAHAPVEALDAVSAVRAYPDRNVFVSWPTDGEEWCAEAAAAMASGCHLVLIGKPAGGNTGSPSLFARLAADFILESTFTPPQFPGSADLVTVHRRI